MTEIQLRWAAALRDAMAKSRISVRKLARVLTDRGLPTSAGTLQSWREGKIPRNGMLVLPHLSRIMRIPLQDLLPFNTGPGERSEWTESTG